VPTQNNDGERSIERVIAGFTNPEAAQSPPGRDGDPQLAALCQVVLDAEWQPDEVLVDFGSGNGILPYYLCEVGRPLPTYWAIDEAEPLARLALPSPIHNRSRKYTIQQFFDEALPEHGKSVRAVVIRNTLHEMTIIESAQLFDALSRQLTNGARVLIQDIERLSKPERGNVAWERQGIEAALQEIGFTNVGSFGLTSRAGTPWYSLSASVATTRSETASLPILKMTRERQNERILKLLEPLRKNHDEGTAAEYALLTHEHTSLTGQLMEAASRTSSTDEDVRGLAPAVEGSKPGCGLVEVLPSKQTLNFPELFASARHRLWFAGYSNRLLFQSGENCVSLTGAIGRAVDVRVLVTDPDSRWADLRSQDPIYENPNLLIDDIHRTIRLGSDFKDSIQYGFFTMKISTLAPSWSYFICDDTAYLSMYSRTKTGSSAPCFVFQDSDDLSNYFPTLLNEFLELFERAEAAV
jgi:hypothetical protein